MHVVLRVERDIGSLRKKNCFQAIRLALGVVLGRPDFRIVHISIQRTHIHLLVEATNEEHLARGLQSFQISAARALNAAITRRGSKRKGRVFVDRYHPEVITNPRQARHCLSYVLNNWRKHKENERYVARTWKLDPYSSAMAFYGWAEQPAYWNAPETYERPMVSMAETWLLHGALALYDPISIYDVPRSN